MKVVCGLKKRIMSVLGLLKHDPNVKDLVKTLGRIGFTLDKSVYAADLYLRSIGEGEIVLSKGEWNQIVTMSGRNNKGVS